MIDDQDWTDFKNDPTLSKSVFRSLDPDHSGDVSLAEFSALQYLWNELELSILEFLKFTDRNSHGNFERAWDELDDGTGALDLKTWKEGVRLVGYFGHRTPIFYYAAEWLGREAVMTRKSWEKLQEMWRNRRELYAKLIASDPDA